MKIIVAHPGQQHSYRVASAVKSNGSLFKYITAVYDKKNNFTMRLAHKIVKGEDAKKILKRKNKDLTDNDVITYYTFLSLGVIVLSRFKITKKFSFWLDRRIADLFGIKVAKYAISHEVDAVICFSMNEVSCFKYLKKHAPYIKRIVDYANTPVSHMVSIYEKDCELDKIRKEVPLFWNKRELVKQKKGIALTHFFLAPSNFVADGLLSCGVDKKIIEIIPYGSNFDTKEIVKNKVETEVRLIYVGQVTYRKGVHHLLEAFSNIKEKGFFLDIVGEILPDSELYDHYKEYNNIKFWGNVSHSKVQELLNKADIFIFSSLADSFSLAVLEAMSCGLPVICSRNAGASDLVIEEKCGEVVNPYNTKELEEKIRNLAFDLEKRNYYSYNAIKGAKKYSWDYYNANVINFLDKMCI